jgi:hypothetical protein
MTTKRSGWLVYASVMMLISAVLYLIWAVNLWADAAWLADVSNGILGDQQFVWGLFDAGLAILFTIAGLSLLDGRPFGRWFAVVAASIAFVRWFYWLAFAPFLSLVLLVMIFLVLYGVLVTWGEDER